MKGDERIVRKFLTDSKRVTIEDCDKLLTLHGYTYHKSRGSHRVYHKKGETPIVLVAPKRTKYIKSGYVDKILRKLKMEGQHESER